MFKNAKLITLFFTMIVVMIGFGIVIPIMPFYIEHFGAGGAELGAMMAVFSLMQFIFSPFWGGLSDRYGRKWILLAGVLGNALSLLMMGLAGSFPMLLLARTLGGILSSATLPTAMAYISDSTDEESRGGGMGVIGAAMGVGMILGPGIGGWLSAYSLSTPFFAAAGLSLLALLLIWRFLPESLPEELRSREPGRVRGVQLGVLWQALFGPMGFLLFLAFLVNFALASFEAVFGLYADLRFNYGPQEVGSILVVVGLVSTLVQGVLTGPATRWLGEATVIKLSLISSVLGFFLMTLFVQNTLVLLTVGFFVFSNAMLRPAIMSLASKLSTGGQGMALGLNNAFQSLGRVVGPLWAGLLIDLDVNLPYLSGAVIMLASFLYAMWAMQKSRLPAKAAPSVPIQAD